MLKTVIKRDGTREVAQPAKLNGWSEWSAKEFGNYVDWADIAMCTAKGLPEVCHSKDLMNALIKECLERDTYYHNRMAGRLYAATLHKDLYGKGNMPSVREVHQKLVDVGYMRELDYSDEEYAELNKLIKHRRDFKYAHYQIYHIRFKYALRNRLTGEEMESPQFVFMRMAMALAETQPKERRMADLKYFYEFFHRNVINAPTPNYVNLGTHLNGYASCCLYTTHDTAHSLAVGDHIGYMMTVQSAGIGNNLQTRSIGDAVRGGLIKHQGKLPYYRSMQTAVSANVQNGRAGACTTYYSAFDPEVDKLVRLKNPRTPAARQIRGMDYNQMSNRFFVEKVANDEEIFLFNIKTAPDLHAAFFSADIEKFREIYERYERDASFAKIYLKAREICLTEEIEAYETGRAFASWMDEINRHTPYLDPIHSSNLCVAPETLLLTDQGHQTIGTLEGQKVNIWNGSEWSDVDVIKTSEASPLLKVQLSDGRGGDFTLYHKWYIQRDHSGKLTEVRTHELEPGDKLIKMDLPVIEGTMEFERAYLAGFFTGEGCQTRFNSQRIDLYGEKQKLKDCFGETLKWHDKGNKLEAYTDALPAKFTVPHASHRLEDRLSWLAGWLDAEGCVYRNGTNESLVGSGSNIDFLKNVQHTLQTMGVNAKISKVSDAGYRKLPLNDGSGIHRDFWCPASYRLLISSGATQDLLAMGLKLNHLAVSTDPTPRRAEHFAVVVDIIDEGRVDETYCVTEPKRHMAVFNGILTGQCAEVVEPTEGYANMQQLYTAGPVALTRAVVDGNGLFERSSTQSVRVVGIPYPIAASELREGMDVVDTTSEDRTYHVDKMILQEKEPEVALCSLGGLVITNIATDQEYEQAMYYTLLMIDKCIHMSDYPLPHVGYTAKNRLAAAVGIMDLAHWMARKKLKYTSKEGKEEIHRVAERHMYFAIKASLRLAKELGNCPWSHRTKWARGWLPIDTYNRNVDKIVQTPLIYDWESLRAEVVANGGIRNSALVAYMPGESSSKASGTANSVYPIRELTMIKTDNSLTTYWCAPESDKLGRHYQSAWEIPTADMIDCYGIIQKFTDQAISADLYRKVIGSEKITSTEILTNYIRMSTVGLKTRYYTNTHTAGAFLEEGVDGRKVGIVSDVNVTLTAANDDSQDVHVQVVEDVEMDEFDAGRGCASGACDL